MIDYVYILNLTVDGKSEHMICSLPPGTEEAFRGRLRSLAVSGIVDSFSLEMVPVATPDHLDILIRELEISGSVPPKTGSE